MEWVALNGIPLKSANRSTSEAPMIFLWSHSFSTNCPFTRVLQQVIGILLLFYSIFSTCLRLRNNVPQDALPVLNFHVAVMITILTFFVGNSALKSNNKDQLRLFSILVFIAWLAQFSAYSLMANNFPNRLASVAKTDIIAGFDEQRKEVQNFIHLKQQQHACCGMEDWQDYGKAIGDLPG